MSGSQARCFGDRQSETEPRSAFSIVAVFGPDATAVVLDDPSRDRQTESHLPCLAFARTALREALEDQFELVFGHAGARIGDFEVRPAFSGASSNNDLGAGGRQAEGVLQEVSQDLAQGGAVGNHRLCQIIN